MGEASRREFLQGAALAAAGALSGCATVDGRGRDPNFSVLVSDLHVGPDGCGALQERFRRIVLPFAVRISDEL